MHPDIPLQQNPILFHGFLIKTKQIIDQKMGQNPISFFVAEIVGSYEWPYPFSKIYDYYYHPAKAESLNWNTARTQAGRLYAYFVPEIERELQVKIIAFQVDRKGHKVNCYKVI